MKVQLEPADADGALFGARAFLVDSAGAGIIGANECCVCLSTMEDGSVVVNISCDQQLHVSCWDSLVRHAGDEQPLCPLCRRAF